TWSVAIAGSVLAANGQVGASVTTTDGAGNSATADASRDYTVDTEVSASITIDTIAGDDIVNAAESGADVTVSGTVGGDVAEGDTVTVTVGENSYEAQVGAGGTWSVAIAGSVLAANGQVGASVTTTDGAGNSATADASRDYTVDLGPTADPSQIVGTEDTPLVFAWADFGITSGNAGDQGILITSLPQAGTLQIQVGGGTDAQWVDVTLADGELLVSRQDIESGMLRFVPDSHESGWDGADAEGVGNNLTSYAEFSFNPVDASGVGATSSLTIDINPVADAPDVGVEVISVDTVEGSGSGTVYSFQGVELTVSDAGVSATGLSGQVLLPPFNSNINDNSSAVNVVAVMGNFADVVPGSQNLNGINAHGDYIFFDGPASAYSISNVNNNGPDNLSAKVTLDGISVNINNARGILFADGTSYGWPSTIPDLQVTQGGGEGYTEIVVNVSAALVDTDGSETLSGITLLGIPAGATVIGAQAMPDGSWYIANAQELGSITQSVTVRVPEGTPAFQVQAVAQSTEAGGSTAVGQAQADVAMPSDVTIEITSIGGDDVIDTNDAALGEVTIQGTLQGVSDGSAMVVVTVAGTDYVATVAPDGLSWSVDIDANALAGLADSSGNGSISASVTVTSAQGSATYISSEYPFTVDIRLPDSGDAAALGLEDTALVLTWAHFDINSDGFDQAQWGITLTQLPANGSLEFKNVQGEWVAVQADQRVTKADIDAGQLRFVPLENESGSDAMNASGVGNGQADYAHIGFVPYYGLLEGGAETIRIDVSPVVDTPYLEVEQISSVNHAAEYSFEGITIAYDKSTVSVSGIEGNVLVPPFDLKGSGNLNPSSLSTKQVDVIAMLGTFASIAQASDLQVDPQGKDPLISIKGDDTDIVFFNGKSTDYTVSGLETQDKNKAGVIIENVQVTDPEGTTVDISRVKGLVFGDGQAYMFDDNGGDINVETSGGFEEVTLDLAAALMDLDGSESLSGITLTNIPAGVTIDGALSQGNGVWFIPNTDDTPAIGQEISMRVPYGAESFVVQASVTATEQDGQSADSSLSVAVEVLPDPYALFGGDTVNDPDDSDDDSDDESDDEDGSGADDDQDGDSGSDAPVLTGEDLLVNGDFSSYGSDTNPYSAGNIYQGFIGWQETGPLTDGYWRMNGKPYVGVWEDTIAPSSLTQTVSGVTGGSVVQFQVAWNNPDHQWGDTGNSVSFTVRYAGVDYVAVTTPAPTPQGSQGISSASITAGNGATVDVDSVDAWLQEPGSSGGNSRRPDDLSVFQTVNVTLPDDVPESGVFELRWEPSAQGGSLADDVMVANVKLLQAEVISDLEDDEDVSLAGLIPEDEEELFGVDDQDADEESDARDGPDEDDEADDDDALDERGGSDDEDADDEGDAIGNEFTEEEDENEGEDALQAQDDSPEDGAFDEEDGPLSESALFEDADDDLLENLPESDDSDESSTVVDDAGSDDSSGSGANVDAPADISPAGGPSQEAIDLANELTKNGQNLDQ
ncbi:MAG: Ig-like domain-containing protein, partial [Burkholderiaceae bacterium]